MLDVAVPTTAGRELLLVRRVEPSSDVQLLFDQLELTLLPQPPPRIRSAQLVRWRPFERFRIKSMTCQINRLQLRNLGKWGQPDCANRRASASAEEDAAGHGRAAKFEALRRDGWGDLRQRDGFAGRTTSRLPR